MISFIKQHLLRSKGILFKFLFSYFLLSFFIISLLGFLSYKIAEDAVESKISSSTIKTLAEVSDKITLLINDINNFSDMIYLNKSVQNALSTEDDHTKSYYYESVNDFFSKYRLIYNWLGVNAHIFGFNNYSKRFSINSTVENTITYDLLKKQYWYDSILVRDGKIHWVNKFYDGKDIVDNVFSSVRLLIDVQTGKPIGILVLTFDKDVLGDLYKQVVDETSNTYIITRNCDILSGTKKVIPNIENIVSRFSGQKSGSFIENIEGEKQLVLYHSVDKTNWYIVQTIPLKQLLKFTSKIKISILIISIVCIALSLIFSYNIANQLYKPIKRLIKVMKEVRKGDFSLPSIDTEREDEFGQLNKGFTKMVQEVDGLFNKLVEEQHKKRQAEIQMLQAQINPHFLYNTLSTVRCVVNLNQKEAANEMIISLVKLLKVTLNSTNEFITLGEEIENLKNYVFIQKYRYNNFEVSFNLDEDLLNCKILKLTLQPLVENAIFHGLKNNNEVGMIHVSISKKGEDILLKVTDNGIGIPPEKVDNILDLSQESSFNSIGLKNVHERIRLYFGNPYGLQIDSEIGKGTTVNINIPAVSAL